MFFKNVLDYVYPKICGICGKIIFSNSYTCANCLSILKCYKERVIINSSMNFDYMLNLYEYKGIIKKQICKFKFHEGKYLAKTFSELITDKITKFNLEFDYIIPVPISFKRYMERGYNQCEEIAKCISKRIHKKTLKNVLIKIKDNKRQSNLKINERKNNVLGVYEVIHPEKIKNKDILLIDDIYTTGATINECTKILKFFGAKKILVITIAYA